jgi:hypothetical protein
LKQAALLFSVLMFAPPLQPQSNSMAGASKFHPDSDTFCRKINLRKHPCFFLTTPRGRFIFQQLAPSNHLRGLAPQVFLCVKC